MDNTATSTLTLKYTDSETVSISKQKTKPYVRKTNVYGHDRSRLILRRLKDLLDEKL